MDPDTEMEGVPLQSYHRRPTRPRQNSQNNEIPPNGVQITQTPTLPIDEPEEAYRGQYKSRPMCSARFPGICGIPDCEKCKIITSTFPTGDVFTKEQLEEARESYDENQKYAIHFEENLNENANLTWDKREEFRSFREHLYQDIGDPHLRAMALATFVRHRRPSKKDFLLVKIAALQQALDGLRVDHQMLQEGTGALGSDQKTILDEIEKLRKDQKALLQDGLGELPVQYKTIYQQGNVIRADNKAILEEIEELRKAQKNLLDVTKNMHDSMMTTVDRLAEKVDECVNAWLSSTNINPQTSTPRNDEKSLITPLDDDSVIMDFS